MLANTWSLRKAAQAHKAVEPQFLAIGLIRLRQSKCTLSTTNNALCEVPGEIWSLVEDELCAQALKIVIEAWTDEYAQWMTSHPDVLEQYKNDYYDYNGCRYCGGGNKDCDWCITRAEADALEQSENERLVCLDGAKMILTSNDWRNWASKRTFDFYKNLCLEWNYESETEHSPAQLKGKVDSEILSFVSLFNIRVVSESFNVKAKAQDGEIYDFYTSIATPLDEGSHDKSTPSLNFQLKEKIGMTSISFKPAQAPFSTLYKRYHVEFATGRNGEKSEGN